MNHVIHKSYRCMNSMLDIVLTDVDVNPAERVCAEIFQLASQYELLLSCHHPEAEVYQINQRALKGYTPVSKPLLEILLECQYYHHITNGYFDIGLRSLKNANGNHHLPADPAGMKAIEIDEPKLSVRFWNAFTAIDLGAVGKGVLLREADKVLSKYDIVNCFISFGGSSVLTRGSHPYGENWPVSFRGDENAEVSFALNNHAASFSESHTEGRSTSHIIHPQNMMPVDCNRITFVQSQCPVEAEAMSTTLIISPVEEAGDIMKKTKAEKAYIFNKSNQHKLSIAYQYGNERKNP
ncbi:MAG TPA: FAD:protein FMN transferase [Bacteroidales bacterium]|nr:FAD:protein FMN transferase [Bacteroidales bacterium]